ncbi:hypothetical protein NX059_012119 [Plenodomus lindquistii]|nr:hypothetical protein NX059_012119 [Plenodomus lindquistii]
MASPDCSEPQDQHGASDGESDLDTPSRRAPSPRQSSCVQPPASSSSSDRQSRHAGRGGQYCTHSCLLGLISLATFLELSRQQLSQDLDQNCKPIGIHGACGVPFLVRLEPHGYVVVAKACPIDFVCRLRWEAAVYDMLCPVQGTYVPVLLDNVDLDVPYYYEGIAKLVHMMFLSYGGKRMDKQLASADKTFASQQVDKSVKAIRMLGILHRDLAPRNMLWDDRARRVMVIDFERAEMEGPRLAGYADQHDYEYPVLESADSLLHESCRSTVLLTERPSEEWSCSEARTYSTV